MGSPAFAHSPAVLLSFLVFALLVSAEDTSETLSNYNDDISLTNVRRVVHTIVPGAVVGITIMAFVGCVLYYILIEGYSHALQGHRLRGYTRV